MKKQLSHLLLPSMHSFCSATQSLPGLEIGSGERSMNPDGQAHRKPSSVSIHLADLSQSWVPSSHSFLTESERLPHFSGKLSGPSTHSRFPSRDVSSLLRRTDKCRRSREEGTSLVCECRTNLGDSGDMSLKRGSDAVNGSLRHGGDELYLDNCTVR